MKFKALSTRGIPDARLFHCYLLLVALMLSSAVLALSLPIPAQWILAYAGTAGLAIMAGGIAFTIRFAKQAKGR